MRMQRGCKGGLRLLRPHLDQAAGALAAYLRACGCSDAELAETASVAAPILASLDDDDLFICLYRRTITLLASGETAGAGGTVRGTVIATRLIRHGAPIPEEGAYLGSEADLCAKFSCGRSTFRQALRILDDLGMLHVRRGRGGGYALKRPSSIGVVRQLFALLASRQQTLENIIPVVWALNLVNLRLAMHRFRQLSPGLRAERCDGLAALLVQSSEPRRWGLLQQALSRAANNTMVSTLLRCMVAYHARLGPPPAVHSELDEQLRTDEEAIVQALRRGRDAEAESHHRRAQARLSQMFHCSDLPGSEHAFLGHA
ncbi:MAG: FadR family transcriptional regulator [Rhodospirillaceae bacterium]|nr:MAG: FadR family transcriptional regulator [Rhodospirillaceae bacterium]